MRPVESAMSGYGSSYSRAYVNQRQAALMQEANLRMARMLKAAQSDAARLAVADQARTENDLQTACRIYVRVANSRVQSPAKLAAKERLSELDSEVRAKHNDVQERLLGLASTSANEQNSATEDELRQCLDEFEALVRLYGRVPAAGKEMRNALARHKNDPAIQVVIQEPEAQRLWEIAQKLEADGQVCCAFQVYEEAVRQLPAPSAQRAADRLAELQADAQQVAAAEACRNLQWCHRTFDLASRVAKVRPDRARGLFEQVVTRAPVDSKVYLAAREQIAQR